MLCGNVKMLQILIILCLSVNLIIANTPSTSSEAKAEIIDELKAPNVLKTRDTLIFKEVIISFFPNKSIAFIIFDLVVTNGISEFSPQQNNDIPLIIDTLISDLFPSANLFINTSNDVNQGSLQQRIERVLMEKFKWITKVKITKLRIQETQNH